MESHRQARKCVIIKGGVGGGEREMDSFGAGELLRWTCLPPSAVITISSYDREEENQGSWHWHSFHSVVFVVA